jgi:hypothetical protein
VNQTVSSGLWDLVETCERRRILYRFIHFPSFAEDFDYFWSTLGFIVEKKRSKENSKEIFEQVVDLGKIRINTENFDSLKIAELEAVISLLQRKIHGRHAVAERDSAVAERDSAVAERDSAVAERDSAVAERDSVFNSTIWGFFGPYRKLIRFVRRI